MDRHTGGEANVRLINGTSEPEFAIRISGVRTPWRFTLGMRHRDHDVSLLVSLLNILECFSDPFQRIASVDDRPERPSVGQCGDETHVRHVSDGHASLDLLSAGEGGPKHPNDVA